MHRMTEFRVGDQVRIKHFMGSNEMMKRYVGKRGLVIDELHLVTRTHMVRLDVEPEFISKKRGKEFLFFPEELELVE